MNSPGFVMGLFNAARGESDLATRSRLRDLSLSWARFGYQGPVIEGTGPRPVLEKAIDLGYEYCLLMASGTIFDENWYPAHWGRRDVHGALADLMDDGDFLAAGRPLEDPDGTFKIDERFLLVNTARYDALGRPPLEGARLVRRGAAEAGGEPERREWSWSLYGAPNDGGAIFRAIAPETSVAIVHLAFSGWRSGRSGPLPWRADSEPGRRRGFAIGSTDSFAAPARDKSAQTDQRVETRCLSLESRSVRRCRRPSRRPAIAIDVGVLRGGGLQAVSDLAHAWL